MGGVAAAVGYLGVGNEVDLFGQQVAPSPANRARQAMASAANGTRSPICRVTRTAGDRLNP
jgi:hypothetical protein